VQSIGLAVAQATAQHERLPTTLTLTGTEIRWLKTSVHAQIFPIL